MVGPLPRTAVLVNLSSQLMFISPTSPQKKLFDLVFICRLELDQLLQASILTGLPPPSPRDPWHPWLLHPRVLQAKQLHQQPLPRANLAAELPSLSQAQHRTSSQGNDKHCQIMYNRSVIKLFQNFQHWCCSRS